MRGDKMGAMFLISVLAIAGIGITYAGFTDEIQVFGTVTTAEIDLVLKDYSCTYVWKVWNFEKIIDWPDDSYFEMNMQGEIAIYRGPCIDTEEYERQFIGFDYELQSWAKAMEGDADDTVIVEYYNLFPCIDFVADFIVHYTGTIPGRIDYAHIFSQDQWLQDLWALHLTNPEYGIWVESYKWNIQTNDFLYDDTGARIPVDVGDQIHNCEHIWVGLFIHLPQVNELQGKSGTFEGKVGVIQWYDDECPCEIPYFEVIDKEYSDSDETPWSGTDIPAGGLELPGGEGFTYLNLGTDTATNTPLADGYYPFYLQTDSVPDDFYSWWASDPRNVFEGCGGDWQPTMWQIISGNLPMFYVRVTGGGTEYMLVDGLQYLLPPDDGDHFLRVSNDYPTGNYWFKGYITAECGYVSDPIYVSLYIYQD